MVKNSDGEKDRGQGPGTEPETTGFNSDEFKELLDSAQAQIKEIQRLTGRFGYEISRFRADLENYLSFHEVPLTPQLPLTASLTRGVQEEERRQEGALASRSQQPRSSRNVAKPKGKKQ